MASVSMNVMMPDHLVAAIDEIAKGNQVNRSVVVRTLVSRALAAPAGQPRQLDLGLDRHPTKVVDR